MAVILPKRQFALGKEPPGLFLEGTGEIHTPDPQAPGLLLKKGPLGVRQRRPGLQV